MKNKQIVPIALVSISSILFLVAIVLLINIGSYSLKNKVEDNKENKNKLEETSKIDEDNKINDKEMVDEKTDLSNNNLDATKKPIVESNNSTNDDNFMSEDSVISYFSSRESLINPDSNQEDKSIRQIAKETFTTIIDFIFYDKEIKGYTFSELTTSAKLKVIGIALSIDHKIDSYFPNYKEDIKDKYLDIKGKLALKYIEFTSMLCDKVGEDTCNQAKEDFNTMKEGFNLTIDLVKEMATNGGNKIKDFYESWRDS